VRRLTTFAGLLASVAALAAAADARPYAPSGDTCTYSGAGGLYTVRIVTGSGVQQYGFAFGAPGLTVTNVSIPGQNGGFTGGKLASGTTGAWVSDTPMTGSLVATLTVGGTATGPVVIVPTASGQSSYYDPVTCTVATSATGGATARKIAFTVAPTASWSAIARGWHLTVSVPAPAIVSAKQPLAKNATTKPRPLVQARRVASKTGGTVTLTLKATPAGQAILAAEQSLTVRMAVTVDTNDGREAHKTVRLTLRK